MVREAESATWTSVMCLILLHEGRASLQDMEVDAFLWVHCVEKCVSRCAKLTGINELQLCIFNADELSIYRV